MHELKHAISGFDGKATTLLGEAEARFGHQPGYLDKLIALMGEPEGMIQSAATWLLRSALESGRTLEAQQISGLVGACRGLTEWSAQLHVCQLVPKLELDPPQAQALADWLTPLLAHERPFLRAWALDAFCQMARYLPPLAGRARAALAAAHDDRSASVRARARNITPPE